jgi:hypothetical protein
MLWIFGFPLYPFRAVCRLFVLALVACMDFPGLPGNYARRTFAVLVERALKDARRRDG